MYSKLNIPILFLYFLFTSIGSFAQKDTVVVAGKDSIFIKEISLKNDTIVPGQDINPKKAALFSAALPGLGQVYNKKYWKVPIIYGAIGTALFYADFNNKNYHRFLDAYTIVSDTSNHSFNELEGMNIDLISFYKKKYRRNRDLSLIVTGVLYIFNIVDASVDANLSDYDVGNDLSLHIEPSVFPLFYDTRNAFGLSLAFRF